jgi:hypothetical protein
LTFPAFDNSLTRIDVPPIRAEGTPLFQSEAHQAPHRLLPANVTGLIADPFVDPGDQVRAHANGDAVLLNSLYVALQGN